MGRSFSLLWLLILSSMWALSLAELSIEGRESVEQRLDANAHLVLPCKYSLVDGNERSSTFGSAKSTDIDKSIVKAFVYEASAQEIAREKKLPRIRTGANHLLGHSPRAARWGNLTGIMWQLPPHHPRQVR